MVKKERRIHWPSWSSRDPFRTFCGKIVEFKYIVPAGEPITCVSCTRKRAHFDGQQYIRSSEPSKTP